MTLLNFSDCRLYLSLRSPFARRVRLALLEHDIPFTETILDVFKPNPELFEVNPLGRVPTLTLRTGEVLVDSHLILQCFYENIDSPLKPKELRTQLQCYFWSALATGVCDKLVEFYIESLKPREHRDPEIKGELVQVVQRVLPRLEQELSKGDGPWLVGNHLTQTDLDMGTALTYLKQRYSSDWQVNFPAILKYIEQLQERPSFQKTNPPAA